ncbi:MAG TPA: hypothetical protein DDW27_15500 [Bacteroidales bacterium]|nr:hypothetical protein [Bacteroidales bacterium]
MTYIIIGDSFTFPEGDAATNRVYAYAKGFVENSVNVHVVGFRGDYLPNHSGETEGIKYHHPFRQIVRHNNFFVRRWQKIKKYRNTVSILKEINNQDRIKQVTVYTTKLTTHFFAWFLSERFKAKLIKECSEHPLRLYQKNIFTRTIGHLKFKIEIFLSDGIICISQFLIDFHRLQGYPGEKLLLVPSTVDPARFEGSKDKPLPYKYIGYFGALTFKRDNVDLLIRAFVGVYNAYPDYFLVLGGPGNENDRAQILDLINNLGISSRAKLLEYMPRNEITKYISGSDILVMTRSKDLESQASFPSKLTEYLASSRPLITVKVGEVGNFLSDGVNALLVEPGDEIELADKLKFVIDNYNLAIEIAERGRLLTLTTFNYNYQAKRIIQFIDTLG